MASQGVSRSDSEIAQKSCVSGAPTSAAQVLRAEAPGTISTSMSPGFPLGGVHPAWKSTSKVGPAMPYTPGVARGAERHLAALAGCARGASMARSSSSVIDLRMTSLPSSRSATRRM